MAVRVRFAPSPTGHLHLGGFRTALLNYLFARKHQGSFLLRVEDTDQARTVPGAMEQLEDDLNWLGLKPDESPRQGGKYGPYIQSQRLGLYQKFQEKLIESSAAYECFCTEKRLDLIRKEAVRAKAKPGYDNKCRDLTRNEVIQKKALGERYVVRLKLDHSPVEFNDALYGNITLIDKHDPVMVKSDGFPTYHFANVIDDRLMEITHVLRGLEWQISTGIHIQLYRAFQWQPPKFAHLPVLLNKDGAKLSKRHADISISNYKSDGCAPLVLANFVTKSGGGFYHNVDKLFTLEELSKEFDLRNLNSNPCRLDFNLLEELKRRYIHMEIDQNFEGILRDLQSKYPSVKENYLRRILSWCKPRINSIKELDSMYYLWAPPNNISSLKTPKVYLEYFRNSDLEVKKFIATHEISKKHFSQDLRTILCGLEKGPPVQEVVELLGPDEVKSRIDLAISKL
ncbi:unnamed protein product [Allacma fusca]|uniref:Nondiscriminating glutamyl-tRNA synthetase EARS2, mitochondrial n=1 Tax=Allacma fusca TaxID=39272 RepID=A0A8J2K3T1_9HEXA|nr:unnamed protein product [Allacma fusca]